MAICSLASFRAEVIAPHTPGYIHYYYILLYTIIYQRDVESSVRQYINEDLSRQHDNILLESVEGKPFANFVVSEQMLFLGPFAFSIIIILTQMAQKSGLKL